MRNKEEGNLQKSAVAYLRLVLTDALVFAVPNGGTRNIREAANLKAQGVLAGIPDVFIWAPGGKCFAIEFKAAKGRLSPSQFEVIDWCIRSGCPYVIARSMNDVMTAIKAWNLNVRESRL